MLIFEKFTMAISRRLVVLFLFILTITPNITSQDVSDTYKSDTAHVNEMVKIAGDILYMYPDSANKYVDTILLTSTTLEYEFGLFKANNLRGIIYWMKNNLDISLSYYKTALNYANSKEFPRRKAILLSNIGLLYSSDYNTDSAILYLNSSIDYTLKNNIHDLHSKSLFYLGNLYTEQDNYLEAAKNLFEIKDNLQDNPDSALLMYTSSSMGVLYAKMKKFDDALNYYRDVIAIDNQLDNYNILAQTYINIGQLYFDKRNCSDSAVYYFKKAVFEALPHNMADTRLSSIINQGNVFLEKGELDSAYVYYNKAIVDTLINYMPYKKAAVMVNIGLYQLNKLNFSLARTFLETGYHLADSLELLLFKKNSVMALSQLDSAIGNFKQSLILFKEYHDINNKIHFSTAKNQIAILEFERYLAKQKNDNMLLVNENSIKSTLISFQKKIIILAIIITFILLFLIYILFRNKFKIKLLLNKLSVKHEELSEVNEELIVSNDILLTHQEKLKELNITKDKFFSILGHDLKSPFNSLLGLLQIIDEDWDNINDDEKRTYIQSLLKSSTNTYLLLEDLLTWGRAQRGLLEYNPEKFILINKIQYISELFDIQLKLKSIELLIEVPENMELTTDPRYLTQIIQNLVNNAIKFTPMGGNISIISQIINQENVICVIDNGIGIPENKIESIFNLDADFNRPGTNGEKSTGMGLILSKEYANLIGAKFSVSSIEPNISKNIIGETKFCLILK